MTQSKTPKQILDEIESRRNRAIYNAEQKKKALQEDFPRLKAIESEIADAGLLLFQNRINGLSEEKAKETYRQATESLEKERLAILAEAGILPESLEPAYTCPICKDTGFVDGQKCQCLKQMLNDAFFNRYDLTPHAINENFETFDINVFPAEHQLRARKVFSACKNFCAQFESIKSNLIFTGLPGRGKTFMCNCIAGSLIQQGYQVIYITAAHLTQLAREVFYDETHLDKAALFDAVSDCDLLIIDDLGAEHRTAFAANTLFDIINTRLLSDRRMIISTNLDPEDIGNQYDPRLSSRIKAYFKVIPFIGEDIRVTLHKA